VATAADLPEGSVQTSQPLVGVLSGLATPLLRGAEGRGSPVEGPFLTVAEAAGVLRASTATVHKLCAHGELAHVRVLNVIRIPSEAMGMLRRSPRGAVP
jgi:excisionase family DNA binding protein